MKAPEDSRTAPCDCPVPERLAYSEPTRKTLRGKIQLPPVNAPESDEGEGRSHKTSISLQTRLRSSTRSALVAKTRGFGLKPAVLGYSVASITAPQGAVHAPRQHMDAHGHQLPGQGGPWAPPGTKLGQQKCKQNISKHSAEGPHSRTADIVPVNMQ